jgi:hypothetical protein
LLKAIPELTEIVDFTIEDNDVPSVERRHRLVPTVGQVQDRQPRMRECCPGLGMKVLTHIIRAAVPEPRAHR